MLFFALFRITRSHSRFISKLNWSVELRVDMSAVTPGSLDDVSSWLSTDLEAFLRNDSAEPEPSSSKNADASTHEAHQQTDKNKKKKQTHRQKSNKHSAKTTKSTKNRNTTTPKPTSSSSTHDKTKQHAPEPPSPRSPSPSVDPWSTDSVAAYDMVHPIIRYDKPRRTCAKMLVRAGLRCRCHFRLLADCPSRHGTTQAT